MKAKDLDSKFDAGQDITGHLDLAKARRPGQEQKRFAAPHGQRLDR